MAEADDVEEEEVRERSEEYHPSYCLAPDSSLNGLVSSFHALHSFCLLKPSLRLRRGAEGESKEKERDHREDDRVDCDPEVLDYPSPEERAFFII